MGEGVADTVVEWGAGGAGGEFAEQGAVEGAEVGGGGGGGHCSGGGGSGWVWMDGRIGVWTRGTKCISRREWRWMRTRSLFQLAAGWL